MAILPLILPSATCWRSWRARCAAKKNEHLRTLLKRAKANLRTCIAQNEKRLTFPELFTPLSPPTRSPYRWNDKFTKRDLIELATALEAIQAVVDSNGKPASFTQLIEHFSFSFNLSISSKTAYNEREYIRNVRRKSSEFIHQLEQALSKKV